MSNTSMVELLKRRIEEVLRDWRYVSEQMNEFSEWNSMEDLKRNFGLLKEFVQRLVLVTEAARKDLTTALGTVVSSSEARKALKETLDAKIELPVVLEMCDGLILGALIDWACDVMNARYGHVWDTDVAAKAAKAGTDPVEALDRAREQDILRRRDMHDEEVEADAANAKAECDEMDIDELVDVGNDLLRDAGIGGGSAS